MVRLCGAGVSDGPMDFAIMSMTTNDMSCMCLYPIYIYISIYIYIHIYIYICIGAHVGAGTVPLHRYIVTCHRILPGTCDGIYIIIYNL